MAIRFGALADSGVIAKHLGSSQRVLVAAPAYLKKRGRPRSPEDALAPRLRTIFEQDGGFRVEAPERQAPRADPRRGARRREQPRIRERARRPGSRRRAAPGPYLLAGTALGHLERVLPSWTSAPIPVHAVYLNRRFVPAKVQAFITELAEWKNSTWRTNRGPWSAHFSRRPPSTQERAA